jgi:hypothetical protein
MSCSTAQWMSTLRRSFGEDVSFIFNRRKCPTLMQARLWHVEVRSILSPTFFLMFAELWNDSSLQVLKSFFLVFNNVRVLVRVYT